MPVSRNRRKKSKAKQQGPVAEPSLKFSSVSLKPDQYENFRKAVLEAAARNVAAFPSALKSISDELSRTDPIGILAIIASYGLHAAVTKDGVASSGMLKDLLQHHVELLQALVLAVPAGKLGPAPVTPLAIQAIVDALPKVADTFLHQRLLANHAAGDKVEATLLSLQERIRLHTQGVRNWGYYSAVIRISTDLYSALDERFLETLGFTASNLIDIVEYVVSEYERRTNKHFNTLAKVLSERTVERMVSAYYQLVPDLEGDPEELLAAFAPGTPRNGVMAAIMAHFDLRLSDCVMFKAADIAKHLGLDTARVQGALSAISLAPGSTSATNPELLFLGNPVWEAPGIDLGEVFAIPIPQMFFSHIHRIMERLAAEAGSKLALENRRAEYLEQQLLRVMMKGLPTATMTPSAKWKVGEEQFETDLLIVLDRTVLIAEAKSNRLTASALRGAPDRVKRHVEDLIVYPSIQSARFETLVDNARNGDVKAERMLREMGVDARSVDRVIRISVTLDDFSTVGASEGELKEIGWVPREHQLAPTILIADLECIVEVLDNPVLLLHYLSERVYLQKSFNLVGDELDFLGLYIETGFNIAGLREEGSIFNPTGMSGPIDKYFMGKDAGLSVLKPKAKLRPFFAESIRKLAGRHSPGWTTAGMHLLSVAGPNEQRTLEQKLVQLRGMVRRNHSDPKHLNSVQVQSPENRKAIVSFYLFPEQLRDKSRSMMEHLAAGILEDEGEVETAVIFGRSTEHWQEPYEAVLVASKPRGAD